MFVILYFFLLAISLLVLTASDYPFGIFRHFLVVIEMYKFGIVCPNDNSYTVWFHLPNCFFE